MTLVKTVFLAVKVIDININNGASKLNLFSKLHLVTERNTMVIKNQISVTSEEKEKKNQTLKTIYLTIQPGRKREIQGINNFLCNSLSHISLWKNH